VDRPGAALTCPLKGADGATSVGLRGDPPLTVTVLTASSRRQCFGPDDGFNVGTGLGQTNELKIPAEFERSQMRVGSLSPVKGKRTDRFRNGPRAPSGTARDLPSMGKASVNPNRSDADKIITVRTWGCKRRVRAVIPDPPGLTLGILFSDTALIFFPDGRMALATQVRHLIVSGLMTR